MAFTTVMMLFFLGSFQAARITSAGEAGAAMWVFGGLIFALYSAMGVFAPEWTGRTTTFLASRPVAAWKVFACKWFFGWLNFAVPMLACSLFLTAIVFGSEAGSIGRVGAIAKGTLGGILLATMFYTMTCCFAPRKSSEAFVGLVGLMVFLVMILHLLIAELTIYSAGIPDKHSVFQEMVLFMNPFTWVHFVNPVQGLQHMSILFLEQTALFVLSLWVGMHKWQRSI